MKPIFDLIYSDPPWEWLARSSKGEGRSARNHYSLMPLPDIKDLPIASIAAPKSVLAMWVIDPMLPQALELADSWGFQFTTVGFYWIKTNKNLPISFPENRLEADLGEIEELGRWIFKKPKIFFRGLGYYTRANPEQCWLFTRKKDRSKGIVGGGLPIRNHSVDRLIVAPRGRHSEKPEEAALGLEKLFGDVRRVELFARRQRPGWDVFGNQVEGSISLGGGE